MPKVWHLICYRAARTFHNIAEALNLPFVIPGQMDARAIDQVGNQDIFQHVQIVFALVEANHRQFGDVAAQICQKPCVFFFSKRFGGRAGAAGKANGRRLSLSRACKSLILHASETLRMLQRGKVGEGEFIGRLSVFNLSAYSLPMCWSFSNASRPRYSISHLGNLPFFPRPVGLSTRGYRWKPTLVRLLTPPTNPSPARATALSVDHPR